MMFPPIVSAVGNLGAFVMQAIAECLLAALAAFLIGVAGLYAGAAIVWWLLRRVVAPLHSPPGVHLVDPDFDLDKLIARAKTR